MSNLIIAAALFVTEPSLESHLLNSSHQTKAEEINISEKIDLVFDYFNFIGKELKINEACHSDLFSTDFTMIINGKPIVEGIEQLTPHFELLLSQVSQLNIQLHEKVVTENKAIMRYDIEKPGKSKSNVIAIFKFRNGLVYEMNEVVHSVDPKKEIDFTSR